MSAARRITVTGHGLVVVSNLRQSGHGEWQCEVSPGVAVENHGNPTPRKHKAGSEKARFARMRGSF